MRRSFVRVSLFSLASASLLASCADDAPTTSEDAAPNGAVIIRGSQPLTPPSSAPRDRIVRDFLKARGAGSAVDQLRVTRETTPYAGIAHVTMEQTIDGLRVHGAYAKAAIDAHGQLVQVIDHVVRPQGAATKLTISAAQALATTYAELGFTTTSSELGVTGTKTLFEAGGDFYREPTAERVAYLDDHGVLRQGFLVETWSRTDNVLEETLVGWNGKILSSERRTASDSYRVFLEDPLKGGQVVVSGPAAGGVESPEGWLGAGTHSSRHIQGNNARAYLDHDANGVADAGGTPISDGNFLALADLSVSPKTGQNPDFAVQNLFYLNNVVHDALYAAGFDEAAGNFQANNFGRGGLGNDPVRAEAQDGGGTDNANFATPSDGSPPRMQMYLWSATAGEFQVAAASGTYNAAGAGFGPALTTTGLAGNLAVAAVADGCSSFSVASGAIAIIDRGNCDFTVKVMNAQNGGAAGAIVVNHQGDSFFTMGGTNRKIKIPSVMVGQSDGATLKTQAAATMSKKATPPPQLDGDLDADIVFHEYGHGLTWRMIGSMSGTLSGALGEGASDTLAFILNGDDLIGEYSLGDETRGIRRARYAGYPRTYKDLCDDGCQVHSDGEIYAAAMWRFRELAIAQGLSTAQLLAVWVGGMNFTPAGPSYENMRDGLVAAAAQHSPALECAAWQAFAERGIGFGSSAKLAKGGRAVVVTESFALPAHCQ